ncbi:protein SENESCENCE-ASSOCIATED GENE 21, mitochondrial [Oryza sativa Japonica Group]|uniref:Os02g0564600 protein n=3 Tax=Oryza sativa TaxID=4530 RepID=C7IYJ1_ORYSJ|nr:protein SENESCENCE-ASSOCIATED GENE 21, mitochondrial [Oryza sativa Japonica Group]EEC73427.1 hypothetical protein OsI_07699 [Oryza sativa Indica Group]KAB8087535.1 hypothetical protein EE612_011839 [Oryza sativa]EEE57211.1 hypothetical protein OsJ_07172 [Oryza sativa Japonica Group]KAF2945367.1 hypothetical protein DAI22_02g212300 [Oryza sativa Japonica Group]BAH91757.1 Os02g0564600 [Oryza sativa Japonica Group]|eukprot:NP_001173028.1 Os02g0564600 [Oryza sativa Japonica Group]
MPRSAVAAGQLLSLGRRGYAAAAAAELQQRGSSMAARISAAEGGAGGAAAAAASKEIFWMRDPKTGCWVPENRFGDVDAAELRARLLSRKN